MNKCALAIFSSMLLLTAIPVRSAEGPDGKKEDKSLDELLGVGKTDNRESSPETKKLWDGLLAALETSDFKAALPLANQFNDVKDVTEPYQKTFSASIIQILTPTPADASKAQADIDKQVVDKQGAIAEKKKEMESATAEIEQKKAEIDKLRGKRDKSEAEAAEKEGDSDKARGIGGLLGGKRGSDAGSIFGGEGGKKKKQEANSNREKIADLEADIQKAEKRKVDAERAVAPIEKEIADMKDSLRKSTDQQAIAFRDRIASQIGQLRDTGNTRPAVALANTYLKNVTADPEITKLAQACIDALKAESKAIDIAKAVAKPIAEQVEANKLWAAKAKLDEAKDAIALRVTDPQQLKFINRELARTNAELGKRMKDATQKLTTVFEAAARDAADGQKRLDAFLKEYPDYPNADQDKLKLADIRKDQVAKKFEKKLAAIQEVIANDPAEAKAMIKKLMETEIDPDEVSIMNARIVALKRGILEREVAKIDDEMKAAQGFLTTFNATYSNELKSEKVTLTETQHVSAGVENLVAARSRQAGAIKRLELLINEETDNVTKSKLVGLLETHKAAVSQMDDSINSTKATLVAMNTRLEGQQQNARTLTIAAIVGGFVLLGVIAALVLKRKRGPSAA
ncbi:MAG TPA: hypothetical protein VGP72_31330 [Planctomycetota bacterium]|jgi:hypothetical protein